MKLKNNNIEKNIKRNYTFTFLQTIDLTRGIWMIYLATKGMSLTQLGLLEMIFHITSFSMEVPTGAVADLYGRKASRILGRALSVISVIILFSANSFLWFAVSFVIVALSYNMESGAGDALVYDSLKTIGNENEYMRVSGNKEMVFQVANVFSFLLGGYLATRSYNWAFGVTILMGVLSMIYAFKFVEPQMGKKNLLGTKRNHFATQLKESFNILRGHKRLTFLILFSQFLMSFTTTIFFYLQNYMKSDGYNEAFIGAVYAISSLGGAILATQVFKIEAIIKEKGILLLMPIVTAISTWGIALSQFHYAFYIPISLAEGMIFVAIGDYINKVIPSENRATILSMSSMIFSFYMITLFPLIGWLGDQYSLKGAFLFMAILGSVLTVINTAVISSRKV
ncbi:MFS transporter [Fusibacter bizertensis]